MNDQPSQPTPATPADGDTAPAPKTYDLSDFTDIVSLVRENEDAEIRKNVVAHIGKLLTRHKLKHYTVLFLYDDHDSISPYHSNSIYNAASAANPHADILLIVQSRGGSIEHGYLISKTCKSLSKGKFVVAVPRQAKSAATLLALGADEIHMGLMSELGPIDPQIGGYPALGLSNALHSLAKLACTYPASASMWADYLGKNLNLRDLGYLERLSESAIQYAERLLNNKAGILPPTQNPTTLAGHFVNHYKDHGFVIDFDEAKGLLGDKIVKGATTEYKCANDIYGFLYLLGMVLNLFKTKEFYYVGSVASGLQIRDKPKK
ncbi:MAG TPA: ATP-dependent Clp protease proteolytic subunit [Gammaproteobacteria bacterium]|jgi:hypothetical protein